MSENKYIEPAREAFARRVALAYRVTWQSYGFIGDEFSEEKAEELGKLAARYAFPLGSGPIVLNLGIDSSEILEAIRKAGPGRIVNLIEPMTMTYADDGVVGD